MITSAFLHGSVFHVGMNMMTFLSIGSALEKKFGTMWHWTIICFSVISVSTTYVLIASTLYFSGIMAEVMNSHGVGFSGTLFHLLVIQCNLNSSTSHSVFGVFQVSSKFYPWVLLCLIQIIIPNVSFLGHFSGILVGQLHTMGIFNCMLPSPQLLRSMDESRITRVISSSSGLQLNYIKTPFADDLFDTTFSYDNSSSIIDILLTYLQLICKFIKDVLDTIKVIIFGRGREANDNIRLNEAEMSSLLVGLGNVNLNSIGEEEEFVGLPRPLNIDEVDLSENV